MIRMKKYRINELDVWADVDGYTINDVFKTDIIIELENPYDDNEVIEKTKEYYNLPNEELFTNIHQFIEANIFELENNDGKYILQYELVEE
jgi:hypothetical protein